MFSQNPTQPNPTQPNPTQLKTSYQFSFLKTPFMYSSYLPQGTAQKVIAMSLRRRNDWSNPLILKGFKIDCFPFSILRASAHHARNDNWKLNFFDISLFLNPPSSHLLRVLCGLCDELLSIFGRLQLIRIDNILYQLVADDVCFGQVHKGNIIDVH